MDRSVTGVTPDRVNFLAMDDTTRAAVHAFVRLCKATAAVVVYPFHPGAEMTLSDAAYEANAAMNAAGLLDLPQHEVLALVRQEYPDFGSTD